jgi:hypothetical protein
MFHSSFGVALARRDHWFGFNRANPKNTVLLIYKGLPNVGPFLWFRFTAERSYISASFRYEGLFAADASFFRVGPLTPISISVPRQ